MRLPARLQSLTVVELVRDRGAWKRRERFGLNASRYLGALDHREFRLLFVGRTASVLGDALVPIALAFAVLELTSSASAVGLVLGARWLGIAVFGLIGGVWSDRLPRRHVMVTADLARVASQGTVAALLLSGQADVWHLVALTFISGAAAAFFLPATTGLVPQTVPPERLQDANALLALATNSAEIAGPPIAGMLIATVGPGFALAADAASFLVSAVFLAGLSLREVVAARAPSSRFLAELSAGWREFRSRGWLLADGVYSAVGNALLLGPFFVLGPLVAERSFGGAPAWALIVTGAAVGQVGGGVIALRVKPQRPLLVGVAFLSVAALPLAFLAARAPAVAVALAALLGGSAITFYNAVFETTLQQHVPSHALSRVSSITLTASLAFLPLGYAAAGFTGEAIGLSTTLWIAAAADFALTIALLFVPSVRSIRRR